MLDLHGLHVAEAINVLQRELPNFKAAGRVVHILVGTGHHTKERVGGARYRHRQSPNTCRMSAFVTGSHSQAC